MKPGKTSVYLTERVANLLDEHGPTGSETERNIGEKLSYILPAWDRILRSEKARWKELLAREEWSVVVQCTISHAFAMDTGAPFDLDLSGAILACVEDTQDSELMMDDAATWRASTITKLRGATLAAQLTLVWMVIRERARM